MSRPTCSRCGAPPLIAFIKPRFTCPACHAQLSSNLRVISLVEWLVGIGPVLLIAAALSKNDMFAEWSFSQALLLLFVPAFVVHWAVLCQYLRLTEHP